MSCRHIDAGGYRCSRPPLVALRGYCRQHASQLHLPPPVPPPSQPSRRGGRGGGARPATSATARPHGAADADARRRSSAAGRTPTVEQLLSRIDRLRASSPSAESAWSEDSDHETPTLGSSRQYAGSGCTGDSSEAESGPEGPETVDVLHHAGVYTAEEAALLARDELVQQQALYIQQFSRLQHLLREGRRRYLHELKLERQAEADASKERRLAAEAGGDDSERSGHSERGSTADAVPGRSGGRSAAQRNRHDAEEKLRAAWRYHRHRGVCAVLRRKAWDRRADTPTPPGPRCIHTEGGVRCSERCLPGSKYCLKHILNDPNQMLYVPCVGRRNLTLEQRDEEFSRNRRKARRTSTGGRANVSRQPAPPSSRSSKRACARGTNPAVAAVLAARGRARARPRPRAAVAASAATHGRRRAPGTGVAHSSTAGAPGPGVAHSSTAGAPGPGVARSGTAGTPSAGVAHSSAADVAASTAGKPHSFKSVNMNALQRELESKRAADITAAVRNKDAAAFAAALGVEKTPSTEKLVRRRTVARIVDAMERRDAAAVIAARMSAMKSKSSSEKMAASKKVRLDSAREVINKSRKIAALATVLQSEEAVRLVAALKSKDAAAVYAALKSKDTAAVVAALRAKDAAALAAALRPGVPVAKPGNPSDVHAEATVAVPSAPTAGLANVPTAAAPTTHGGTLNVPTTSRFQDAVALMASLKPTDKAAVMAALRARDRNALEAVLKSESVAPIIADLKAKGLIVPVKAAKSKAVKTGSQPVTPTVVRPGPVASVDISVTRRPGDAAASYSAVELGDVSVTSSNRAAPVATPDSEDTGASTTTPESGNAAAPPTVLGSRATAVSPKSKVNAVQGFALEQKVSAPVRTKNVVAAADLKPPATRKTKKRVRCLEPVLRIFQLDMRCPWHAAYIPDEQRAAQGEARAGCEPKEEPKVPKEEVDEDGANDCFGPLNKKIKMELDELTPNIDCIVGEVEMKMETNDEAADDIASVTGSGNQADLSTESTLSATSPRADDVDMDDDCRDVDVDVEEVMLQPPLGADDADLVAVAQGVAVVGAQEEVAVVQQDDDSLTNPPAAVDEVEVS